MAERPLKWKGGGFNSGVKYLIPARINYTVPINKCHLIYKIIIIKLTQALTSEVRVLWIWSQLRTLPKIILNIQYIFRSFSFCS